MHTIYYSIKHLTIKGNLYIFSIIINNNKNKKIEILFNQMGHVSIY